jgi:hypothetical protein
VDPSPFVKLAPIAAGALSAAAAGWGWYSRTHTKNALRLELEIRHRRKDGDKWDAEQNEQIAALMEQAYGPARGIRAGLPRFMFGLLALLSGGYGVSHQFDGTLGKWVGSASIFSVLFGVAFVVISMAEAFGTPVADASNTKK